MTTQQESLLRLTGFLNEAGIPYMTAGGPENLVLKMC